MRIIIACALALSLSLPSAALAVSKLGSKEFDLMCAIANTALLRKERGKEVEDAAFTLFTFYLGRLSARDDKTMWSTVVSSLAKTLPDAAPSGDVIARCRDFYTSKMH